MDRHATLFITHRGLTHQQAALDAAPPELDITMIRDPSKDQIMSLLPGKEIMISERSGVIDGDIIRAGKDLRIIQRLGAQTWDIDVDAARDASVMVCYQPVYLCIMVAEHMVLQILGLAKRLREMMDIAESAGDWGIEPQKSTEDYFAYNWSGRKDILGLHRSTVGIVGFGEIGAELARMLRAFNCTVYYNKRSPIPAQAEREMGIQYAELDDLLARSDYVAMLLPLFAETEKVVNAEFIRKMKKGACLVSAGASGILDEDDLTEAYRSGYLYGVATDTYVWEPIRADNPLRALTENRQANVILTPHTAAGTRAVKAEDRIRDYENLVRFLRGEELQGRLS